MTNTTKTPFVYRAGSAYAVAYSSGRVFATMDDKARGLRLAARIPGAVVTMDLFGETVIVSP